MIAGPLAAGVAAGAMLALLCLAAGFSGWFAVIAYSLGGSTAAALVAVLGAALRSGGSRRPGDRT